MATGPRIGTLVIALLLAILLAAPAPTGAGTVADPPTLGVSDVTVDVDSIGRAPVSLSRVPDGLSGFKLNVSVGDGSVARVVDASYPSSFGITSTTTNGDNTTVTIKAADLANNTKPGDTDVRLASIHVRGEADGTAALTVEVLQLDDDFGGKIQPTTDPGTATVGDGGSGSTPTPTATATERATTPGDDGGTGPTPTATATATPAATSTATSTATATPPPAATSTATAASTPADTATADPAATERTTTAGSSTADGSTDPVPSPTPTTAGTDRATSTSEGGATLIPSNTQTAPASTTATRETETPGQPGFGVPVALVVLLGAGALAARRRRR